MTATFRLGFKNILGANSTLVRHRWRGRAVMLDRELNGHNGARASVYFFVEVNTGRQRRTLKRMFPGWQVARSTHGHNDAYSDPTQHRLITSQEIALGSLTPQQRYVTIARYEHLASGIQWTGATSHLSSSGGTTAEIAAESRHLQGIRLAELCAEHAVDVLTADLNNSATRPETPRAVLAEAGYVDWRTTVAVENADFDTFRPIRMPLQRQGRHLDAIYVGPRASILDGRVLISEPNSSDHLGLVCTVSIAATS